MLEGHFLDLGSFDQCLNLKVPEEGFIGKYCAVEVKGIVPDTVRRVLAEVSRNRIVEFEFDSLEFLIF